VATSNRPQERAKPIDHQGKHVIHAATKKLTVVVQLTERFGCNARGARCCGAKDPIKNQHRGLFPCEINFAANKKPRDAGRFIGGHLA
jgi:hypothetical protein